ncbi:hypothetical protein DFJ74DRAFT_654364 [Hyaloraphidium curvatum]|nr:hypothetical protein DFJ74DRAFT_654364 [Hyaloraphidium curvatum]
MATPSPAEPPAPEHEPPRSRCLTFDPALVAAPFRTEIQAAVARLKSASGREPLLVGFLANDDASARKYAKWTARTCADLGIKYELREVARTEVEDAIIAANNEEEVAGILVYYPIFGVMEDAYLQNVVSPKKDVEGLCHMYRYNLYHNIRFLDPPANQQKCLLPCTPLAIIKILEYLNVYNRILPYGDRLHGRVITIVNRSEVVGRPLAALLANDGAKVNSVDVTGCLEFTRGEGLKLRSHQVIETDATLAEVLPLSDVVITGVPSPSYKVPTKYLRPGVIAINFSFFQNFEESEVAEKASIFVPMIGKVTVNMLARNLVRLYDYQIQDRHKESGSSNGTAS